MYRAIFVALGLAFVARASAFRLDQYRVLQTLSVGDVHHGWNAVLCPSAPGVPSGPLLCEIGGLDGALRVSGRVSCYDAAAERPVPRPAALQASSTWARAGVAATVHYVPSPTNNASSSRDLCGASVLGFNLAFGGYDGSADSGELWVLPAYPVSGWLDHTGAVGWAARRLTISTGSGGPAARRLAAATVASSCAFLPVAGPCLVLHGGLSYRSPPLGSGTWPALDVGLLGPQGSSLLDNVVHNDTWLLPLPRTEEGYRTWGLPGSPAAPWVRVLSWPVDSSSSATSTDNAVPSLYGHSLASVKEGVSDYVILYGGRDAAGTVTSGLRLLLPEATDVALCNTQGTLQSSSVYLPINASSKMAAVELTASLRQSAWSAVQGRFSSVHDGRLAAATSVFHADDLASSTGIGAVPYGGSCALTAPAGLAMDLLPWWSIDLTGPVSTAPSALPVVQSITIHGQQGSGLEMQGMVVLLSNVTGNITQLAAADVQLCWADTKLQGLAAYPGSLDSVDCVIRGDEEPAIGTIQWFTWRYGAAGRRSGCTSVRGNSWATLPCASSAASRFVIVALPLAQYATDLSLVGSAAAVAAQALGAPALAALAAPPSASNAFTALQNGMAPVSPVRQLRICNVAVWAAPQSARMDSTSAVWKSLRPASAAAMGACNADKAMDTLSRPLQVLDLSRSAVTVSRSSPLGHGYPSRVVDGLLWPAFNPTAVGRIPAGYGAPGGVQKQAGLAVPVHPAGAGLRSGGCWEGEEGDDPSVGAWVQVDLGVAKSIAGVILYALNDSSVPSGQVPGTGYQVELHDRSVQESEGSGRRSVRNCTLPVNIIAGWGNAAQRAWQQGVAGITTVDGIYATAAANCSADGVRYVVVRRLRAAGAGGGPTLLPLCELQVITTTASTSAAAVQGGQGVEQGWPQGRYGQAMAVYGRNLFVAGGLSGATAAAALVLEDVWAYDTNDNAWAPGIGRVQSLQGQGTALGVNKRAFFAAHVQSGSLLQLGGSTQPAVGPGANATAVSVVARSVGYAAPCIVPAGIINGAYAGVRAATYDPADDTIRFTCAAGFAPTRSTADRLSGQAAAAAAVSTCLQATWQPPPPFCVPTLQALNESSAVAAIAVQSVRAGGATVSVALPSSLSSMIQAAGTAAAVRVRARTVDATLPPALSTAAAHRWSRPQQSSWRTAALDSDRQRAGIRQVGVAQWAKDLPQGMTDAAGQGASVLAYSTRDQSAVRVFGELVHLSTRGRDSGFAGLVMHLPPALSSPSSQASWATEVLVHETSSEDSVYFGVMDFGSLGWNRTTASPLSVPSFAPVLDSTDGFVQAGTPVQRAPIIAATMLRTQGRMDVRYCPPDVVPNAAMTGYRTMHQYDGVEGTSVGKVASPWATWSGASMRGAPGHTFLPEGAPYPEAPRMDLQSVYFRLERDGVARTWTILYKHSATPAAPWRALSLPIHDANLTGSPTVALASPVPCILVGDATDNQAVGMSAAVQSFVLAPWDPPAAPASLDELVRKRELTSLVSMGADGMSEPVSLSGTVGTPGNPVSLSMEGVRHGLVWGMDSPLPRPKRVLVEVSYGEGDMWLPVLLGPGTGAAVSTALFLDSSADTVLPPGLDIPSPLPSFGPPAAHGNLLGARGMVVSTTFMLPPFSTLTSYPLLYDGITRPASAGEEAILCPVIREGSRPPLVDILVPAGWMARVYNVTVWTTNTSLSTSTVWPPNVWHWVGGPRSEPVGWQSNSECGALPYPSLQPGADPKASVTCGGMRVRHLRLRPRDQNSYRNIPIQVCEEVAFGPTQCAPRAVPDGTSMTYAPGTTAANCSGSPVFNGVCELQCLAGHAPVAGLSRSRCASPPHWSAPRLHCARTCPVSTVRAGSACIRRLLHLDFAQPSHGSVPHAGLWSPSVGWHDDSEGLGGWRHVVLPANRSFLQPGTAAGLRQRTPTTDTPGGLLGVALFSTAYTVMGPSPSGAPTDADYSVSVKVSVGHGGVAGVVIRAVSDDSYIVFAVNTKLNHAQAWSASGFEGIAPTSQERLLLGTASLSNSVLPEHGSTEGMGITVVDSQSRGLISMFVDSVLVLTVPHASLLVPASDFTEGQPHPFPVPALSPTSTIGMYGTVQDEDVGASSSTVKFHSFTVHKACAGTLLSSSALYSDDVALGWARTSVQPYTIPSATHGEAVQLLCPLGSVPRAGSQDIAVLTCSVDASGATATWMTPTGEEVGPASLADVACVRPLSLQYPQTGDVANGLTAATRPLQLPAISGLRDSQSISVKLRSPTALPTDAGVDCPLTTGAGALLSPAQVSQIITAATDAAITLNCSVPAGQGVAVATVEVMRASGRFDRAFVRSAAAGHCGGSQTVLEAPLRGLGLMPDMITPMSSITSQLCASPALSITYDEPVITGVEAWDPFASQWVYYSAAARIPAVLHAGSPMRVTGRSLGVTPAISLGPSAWPSFPATVTYGTQGLPSMINTPVRTCAGTTPLTECFEIDVPQGDGSGVHASTGLCPVGFWAPPGSSVCYAAVAQPAPVVPSGLSAACKRAHPTASIAAFRNSAEAAHVVQGACGISSPSAAWSLGFGPTGPPAAGWNRAPYTVIWTGYNDVEREANNDRSRNWAFDLSPNASAAYALSSEGQSTLWCVGEPNNAGNEDYTTVLITPTAQNRAPCMNDAPGTGQSITCCEAPMTTESGGAAPVDGLVLQVVTGSSGAGTGVATAVPVRYAAPVLTKVYPATAGGVNGTGRVGPGSLIMLEGRSFGGRSASAHPGLSPSSILVAVGQPVVPIGSYPALWSAAAQVQADASGMEAASFSWDWWLAPAAGAPGTAPSSATGRPRAWYWTYARNSTRLNATHILAELPVDTVSAGWNVPVRVQIGGQWSNVVGGGSLPSPVSGASLPPLDSNDSVSYLLPVLNSSAVNCTSGTLSSRNSNVTLGNGLSFASFLSPLQPTSPVQPADTIMLLSTQLTATAAGTVLAIIDSTRIILRGRGFGQSPTRFAAEAQARLPGSSWSSSAIRPPIPVPLPSCVLLAWWAAPLQHGPASCVCNGAEDWVGEGEVPVSSIVSWSDTVIEFTVLPLSGLRSVRLCVGGQLSTTTSGALWVAPFAPTFVGLEAASPAAQPGGSSPSSVASGTHWPPLTDITKTAALLGIPPPPSMMPTASTGLFPAPLPSALGFMWPVTSLRLTFSAETAGCVGPVLPFSPVPAGCKADGSLEGPYGTPADLGLRELRFPPPPVLVPSTVTLTVWDAGLVFSATQTFMTEAVKPRITSVQPNPVLLTPRLLGYGVWDSCGSNRRVDVFPPYMPEIDPVATPPTRAVQAVPGQGRVLSVTPLRASVAVPDTPTISVELIGSMLSALPALPADTNTSDGQGPPVQFIEVTFSGGNVPGAGLPGQQWAASCWTPRRLLVDGASSIVQCDLPVMGAPVGPKNVSLLIKQSNWDGSDARVVYEAKLDSRDAGAPLIACGSGLYGSIGEACKPCPAGALCSGYLAGSWYPDSDGSSVVYEGVHSRPVALEGYYDLAAPPLTYAGDRPSLPIPQDEVSRLCPPYGRGSLSPGFSSYRPPSQPRTLCIAPCEPPEACAGNNRCGEGYESRAPFYRCSECANGYYRRGHICVPCARDQLVFTVIIYIAACVSCAALLVIGRQAAKASFPSSLASVCVSGLDAAQMVAILGTLRLSWPLGMRELLAGFGGTILDLQVLGTGCGRASPTTSSNIWLARTGSGLTFPIVLIALLVLLQGILVCYTNACIRRQWRDKYGGTRFTNTVGRAALSLLSYSYLPSCLAILQVVDCVPTSPPDGYVYLRGTLEVCGFGGQDSLQRRLLFLAAAAFFVYAVGIPVATGYILWRYGSEARLDQLLRAYGSGASKGTNPHLRLRKLAGSLHGRFTPDCYAWQLVILLRRVCIVGCLYQFNYSPGGQVAAMLLVLLFALILQVACKPILAVGNRLAVIREHLSATDPSLRQLPAGRSAAPPASGGPPTARTGANHTTATATASASYAAGSHASLRAQMLHIDASLRRKQSSSNVLAVGVAVSSSESADTAPSLVPSAASGTGGSDAGIGMGPRRQSANRMKQTKAAPTEYVRDRLDMKAWDSLAWDNVALQSSLAMSDVKAANSSAGRRTTCCSSCLRCPCTRPTDPYGSRNWLWTLHTGLFDPNTVETVLLLASWFLCLLALLMETNRNIYVENSLSFGIIEAIETGIWATLVLGCLYWACSVLFHCLSPDPLLQPAAYAAATLLFKGGICPVITQAGAALIQPVGTGRWAWERYQALMKVEAPSVDSDSAHVIRFATPVGPSMTATQTDAEGARSPKSPSTPALVEYGNPLSLDYGSSPTAGAGLGTAAGVLATASGAGRNSAPPTPFRDDAPSRSNPLRPVGR